MTVADKLSPEAKKEQYVRGLSGSLGEKLAALDIIGQMGGGGCMEFDYLEDVVLMLEDPVLDVRIATVVALGDIGEFAAPVIDKILALLEDDSDDLKRSALFAIGQIGPAVADLAGPEVLLFMSEDDLDLKVAALGALAGLKAWTYLEQLRVCLEDSEESVVEAALKAVEAWGEDGQQLAPELAKLLSSPSRFIRTAAIKALIGVGTSGERHAAAVAECLLDGDNVARQAAVKFFETAGKGGKKGTTKVAEGLSSKDGCVKAACVMCLGYLKADAYAKDVAGCLDSSYSGDDAVSLSMAGVEARLPPALRRPACGAALALGMMGEKGAAHADAVYKLLGEDLPSEVTACILKALGLMGAKQYEEQIRGYKDSTAAPVREAMCLALGEIGKETDDALTAQALAERLRDPQPTVRIAAAVAISKMKAEGPLYAEEVVKLFGDKVDKVQIAAIKAMLSMGITGELYATAVARKMYEGYAPVRVAAVQVLAGLGDRGAAFAEDVVGLLGDPEGSVREAALDSLSKMGEEAQAFDKEILALSTDPIEAVRAAADSCYIVLTTEAAA